MAELNRGRHANKPLVILVAVLVALVIGVVAVIMFNKTAHLIPSSVDEVRVSTYQAIPNFKGTNDVYTDAATVAKYRDKVNSIRIIGKAEPLVGGKVTTITFSEHGKVVKTIAFCSNQVTIDNDTFTYIQS